jgi:hypothetical protein
MTENPYQAPKTPADSAIADAPRSAARNILEAVVVGVMATAVAFIMLGLSTAFAVYRLGIGEWAQHLSTYDPNAGRYPILPIVVALGALALGGLAGYSRLPVSRATEARWRACKIAYGLLLLGPILVLIVEMIELWRGR